MVLNENYGYPFERMEIEYSVSFGREKKRADIVIFDKQNTRSVYIMVELKKPKLKDGKEQLKSYCNATGAPIGVWSNGESISFYNRKDPNYFEDIPNIPKATEKLSDVLTERWTISDLVDKDKLRTEKKSLKDLILEMEDEVLANAGVDVFEELFGEPEFLGEQVHDRVIRFRLENRVKDLVPPLQCAVGRGHRAIGFELGRRRQDIDAVFTVRDDRSEGRHRVDDDHDVEFFHRLLHFRQAGLRVTGMPPQHHGAQVVGLIDVLLVFQNTVNPTRHRDTLRFHQLLGSETLEAIVVVTIPNAAPMLPRASLQAVVAGKRV